MTVFNMKNHHINIILLIFITLLITVPFINKPAHIEDYVYMSATDLDRPFIRGHNTLKYVGREIPIYQITHPVLIYSIVRGIAEITQSRNIVIYHLVFLIFPVMAALGMYYLARRFIKNNLTASLLLLFSPGFMVMSHEVMACIPMFSFWIISLAFYIYGIDKDKMRLIILSGIFAGLAVLSSYQALFLLVLFILYPLVNSRNNYAIYWPAFALPLAAFIIWNSVWLFSFGVLHMHQALISSSGQNIILSIEKFNNKMIGNITQTAAISIFPLILFIPFLRKRRHRAVFIISIILGIALSISINWNYTFFQHILFILFFSIGFFIVLRIIMLVFSDSNDDAFLALWFLLFGASATLLLPHACARYLTPLLPPLIILFVKYAYRMRGSKYIIKAALLLTLVLGLLLSIANYQFSSVYPRVARYAESRFEKAYYIGDWGFRYHMHNNNYEYLLTKTKSLPDGSVIIQTETEFPYPVSQELKRKMHLIERKSYTISLPVRIMNRDAKAGFYSHGWGFLPFSFSNAPVDNINIYRIEEPSYFVKNLRRADIRSSIKSGSPVAVEFWTIDNTARKVIYAHPHTAITYVIDSLKHPHLSFKYGINPHVYSRRRGDGVRFIIAVQGDTLFDNYIDPKNNPDQRVWHEGAVDLSEYRGAGVQLTFITDCGPQGSCNYDWAGWSEIEFTEYTDKDRN